MNEENLQSPNPPESDLIITDDSQADRGTGAPEETVSEERNELDSASSNRTSDFASNDLLPRPETGFSLPSSHLPEPKSSGSDIPVSPLTPEIFASGALPAGTMLGHFVVKSFIGGGGMGRVYLATDTALDRKVAVKVLPRQRANDQGTVARFMNEARSAARLNHEHIAQVYFAGEQAGIPYIVFEYVEGTNIRTMVNDFDAFPLPQALNYLIQISHALAHAAEHGVIHRDVKPSNILITKEGRAKLIDMGLARLLDPSESQDDLTASGVTLGTFDYISPEQARDPRNADIRSDIYSLGCTFFFMLSGRPPFPEGTVLQKLLQHQGDEPPDIRAFQPNIPAEVALLMQKMMAKDPRQRFQTPTALIDALVNAAKMLGLQPTGPGKLVWVMTPPSRTSFFLRHVPWLVAVSSLFVIFFFMNLYSERQGTIPLHDLPEHPPDMIVTASTGSTERNVQERSAAFVDSQKTEPAARLSFRVESYESSRFDAPLLRKLFSSGEGTAGTFRVAARFPTRTGQGLGPHSMPTLSFEAAPVDGRRRRPESALNLLDLRNRIGPETMEPAVEDTHVEPLQLCVDPSRSATDSYPTLAAALLEAGKDATIELRWNNVQTVESVVLTDRRIRFIAAEGYYPVLRFSPANPESMFTVTDCELEFRNVALDMRIEPAILAENWSLFGLAGNNVITLQRCCMTIRNKSHSDNSANHDDVAFFRNGGGTGVADPISPAPSATVNPSSDPMPTTAASENESVSTRESPGTVTPINKDRIEIDVTDSILKGEATVFCCDVPQSVELRAKNSLFALAMPFVRTEDTRRTVRLESAVNIDFERITFFGRQSFAYQVQRSHDTHPMRLDVNARQSIFFLNNVALATFRGAPSPQGASDYFHWTGLGNYFQSVLLGWRFRADTSRSSGGLDYSMGLDEWRKSVARENESDPTGITKTDVLRFEEIRKPTHLLLPKDLAPQFLPEAQASEEETRTTGAALDFLDWMPRSWIGEE